MKIKKILTALCIILIGTGYAKAQSTITIRGHVQFNDPRFKISITKSDGFDKKVFGEFDVDANNNFEYKFKVDKPGSYSLDFKGWDGVNFWAEDEDVTINMRGKDTSSMPMKNPPYVYIIGGPKNDLINKFNYEFYRNYQNTIVVNNTLYSADFTTEKERDRVMEILMGMCSEDIHERLDMLVKVYPDVTSIIGILEIFDYEKKKDLFDLVKSKIFAKYPNYKPLVDLIKSKKEAINQKNKIVIGGLAPDFTSISADGKSNITPSNFRGKILLIDFWASWCGPCRGEIPHLKEVYEKYKGKGVEILSVSIDSKEEDWKKALGEEKMAWTQSLAPKSGSEVCSLYQFSGIPFMIILDENGKIAAINVRGNSIDQALDKLINK